MKKLLLSLLCTGSLNVFSGVAMAQTSPSDYTSATRYDLMGRVTGTIAPDPDGGGAIKFAATRNTYDAAGRLTKVENGELANWKSETVAPDAWGGDFTVFQSAETSYDASGRKIKDLVRIGGAGTILSLSQYSYDTAGRPECTTVRMNPAIYGSLPASACLLGTEGSFGPDRITKNVYDKAGQLLQVRKAVGTTVETAYATYSYTSAGKQELVIDANGNKAKLEYDGHNRLWKWTFPSTTKPTAFNSAAPDADPATSDPVYTTAGALNTSDYEQYGYDANGNRTSLRKRDGQTISYSYDALNRNTLKDIPGGTASDVYFGYDLRNLQLYARFVSVAGQGITSGYDGFGRLTSSISNVGGTSRTLSSQYDANGNRTRLTFPDSNYFTYSYDGLDRAATILENGGTQISALNYDNQGQRTGLTGGVTTSYGYDGIGRLASVSHDLSGTAQDLTLSLTSYNPASQLLSQTRSNDAYVYAGHSNASTDYVANGLNQYSNVGTAPFCHDPNGNLTSDGTYAYKYDVENRLIERRAASGSSCPTSYAGALNVSLSYDPAGRMFQTAGAATTQFIYDGDELVAEYDGAGTLLRRYVHGPSVDEPLVWYEGAGLSDRRVLRADNQGSIISVANNGGASIAINSYDEYGLPSASNLGRFQYTGQTWIPEAGLYYYKARMYAPKLGRFMQTDPIGYEDQINLYAYVANDPVNGRDPTGEQSDDIVVTGCRSCHQTSLPPASIYVLPSPPRPNLPTIHWPRFSPTTPRHNFCGWTGIFCNSYENETPDDKPEDFEKLGKKGKKGPPERKKSDGSIWERDRDKHGGSKWKRWPSIRDWERNVGRESVRPDGSVR